jgi:hypothetical protein
LRTAPAKNVARFVSGAAGRFAGFALLCPLGGRLFRGFAGRRIRRFVLHPDGLKTFLGDAQCARAVVIATPHRNRATGSDFFDQPLGQELGHNLAGGTAGQFRRGFKGTVVPTVTVWRQP